MKKGWKIALFIVLAVIAFIIIRALIITKL